MARCCGWRSRRAPSCATLSTWPTCCQVAISGSHPRIRPSRELTAALGSAERRACWAAALGGSIVQRRAPRHLSSTPLPAAEALTASCCRMARPRTMSTLWRKCRRCTCWCVRASAVLCAVLPRLVGRPGRCCCPCVLRSLTGIPRRARLQVNTHGSGNTFSFFLPGSPGALVEILPWVRDA